MRVGSRGSRGQRTAAGITLVEVAVVLVMAAVLAALAVPTYLNLGKRELLQQALEVAQRCREAVQLQVRAMPAQAVGQANGYGCEVLWDPGPSRYVRHMTTSANGVITIVPHNMGDAALDGQPLQLHPWVAPSGAGSLQPLQVAQPGQHQGQSVVQWRCAPAVANPQLQRALPSSCR